MVRLRREYQDSPRGGGSSGGRGNLYVRLYSCERYYQYPIESGIAGFVECLLKSNGIAFRDVPILRVPYINTALNHCGIGYNLVLRVRHCCHPFFPSTSYSAMTLSSRARVWGGRATSAHALLRAQSCRLTPGDCGATGTPAVGRTWRKEGNDYPHRTRTVHQNQI